MTRRAEKKRQTEARLLDAGLAVFAAEGFSAATMDAIAARAGLTKPTLYQYFESKDALFRAVLLRPRDEMLTALPDMAGDDLVAALHRFAEAYARTVMRPDLLSLARLVIGEAHRFPEIGRAYQEAGPDRVLQGLTSFMARAAGAGLLDLDDPELAAEDFWGLILSAPRNRALHMPDAIPDARRIARHVDHGLRVFLRAYSTTPEQHLAELAALCREAAA